MRRCVECVKSNGNDIELNGETDDEDMEMGFDDASPNKVTLRRDNERAVKALAREIAQARQQGSQTVLERPPATESQSNGIIERAVGLVAGQARTLKAALEHRMETRVPPDARILCWKVDFGAFLMNRCDVGSDNKTPLHGLQGRKDNTPILEFAEDFVRAGQASKRSKVGTAISSWSVWWHAGLVVRGGGCHRARTVDWDSRSERQENS